MPWTVSHAAAVLPLRRFSPWPLDFVALVLGSGGGTVALPKYQTGDTPASAASISNG